MSIEALKTLFHPFETELLALPDPGSRILFLGAQTGLPLSPSIFRGLVAVQGFRPQYNALKHEGRTGVAMAEGFAYDVAFVLCGRHRGQNECRVAEALERTSAGALILVAGSKDDGIASMRKRLDGQVAIEGSVPKFHGIAFWFSRPLDAATVVDHLRAGSGSAMVEHRFKTAPGMFSHDRIDAGSKLLADCLPSEMKGRVADFCAGWGYLSAEILGRYPALKSLDLYEADFASLEAARVNVAAQSGIPLRFLWQDLVAEPVTEHYDFIVMNPPFHTERKADPTLGQALIKVASKALKRTGRLLMVANRQLAYERTVAESFHRYEEIAGDGMYKVIAATR